MLDAIAELGISYDEVTELLEKEGVDKFIVSWNELLDTVIGGARGGQVTSSHQGDRARRRTPSRALFRPS